MGIHNLQSDCRIHLQIHYDENLVLQATVEELDVHRDAGNLTAHLLNREKVILEGGIHRDDFFRPGLYNIQ